MYNETIKTDKKDFLCIILITVTTAFVLWIVRKLLPNALLCDILTFMAIGIIAYYVLVGYCSVFSYSVNENELRFSRKISTRMISETIFKKDIIGIYKTKPKSNIKILRMCRSFKKNGLYYILYKINEMEKIICFEYSENFVGKMNELGYKFE